MIYAILEKVMTGRKYPKVLQYVEKQCKKTSTHEDWHISTAHPNSETVKAVTAPSPKGEGFQGLLPSHPVRWPKLFLRS
jgi:hypothetical protein